LTGSHHANDLAGERFIDPRIFFILSIIALGLPNIVFSGKFWFQTLHMMKWFVAMVPVAVLAILAGYRLLRHGNRDRSFRVDVFGWIWLMLLLYVTAQPLWTEIRSIPTFLREWFFFATLWCFYVLCYNGFQGRWLRVLFWIAACNAVLNVVFAELQFAGLNSSFPFILPTPGHYIGNTGQQNMFGFWLAISGLNIVALFAFTGKRKESDLSSKIHSKALPLLLCLLFLFIIGWGLWGSTSRSSILSLACGILFMVLTAARIQERLSLKRIAIAILVLVLALSSSVIFNSQRMERTLSKTVEIVKNYRSIGKRDSIWMTSWTMFRTQPLSGVGLGQYKWHYLDAQKDMLQHHPEKAWKYTYWAHNEYLQWFCEAGLLPGLILIFMAFWWLWNFTRSLIMKKDLSSEAIWACSLLFLIWFNALWTRPFHRIEDALWMSLAFAIANREILPVESEWTKVRRDYLYRALGALIAICSMVGLLYFFHGMAGDVSLRKAAQSHHAFTQRTLLEKAYDHFLVRDLAEKQLAYHYLALGQATKDPEHIAEGINRLYVQFRKQPHSKELKQLLEWAKRIRKTELLQEMASYLKPGTVRIEYQDPQSP
ncbi:MAG TPA: O-antigen ligase family protein, partial [Synergistales bacterium]|nr:O-antigen ligase family protein [Synergistales bacterium]